MLLDLNVEGVQAEAIDCDDRRNVFHVICVGNKKSIIMQAENMRERDEVSDVSLTSTCGSATRSVTSA